MGRPSLCPSLCLESGCCLTGLDTGPSGAPSLPSPTIMVLMLLQSFPHSDFFGPLLPLPPAHSFMQPAPGFLLCAWPHVWPWDAMPGEATEAPALGGTSGQLQGDRQTLKPGCHFVKQLGRE